MSTVNPQLPIGVQILSKRPSSSRTKVEKLQQASTSLDNLGKVVKAHDDKERLKRYVGQGLKSAVDLTFESVNGVALAGVAGAAVFNPPLVLPALMLYGVFKGTELLKNFAFDVALESGLEAGKAGARQLVATAMSGPMSEEERRTNDAIQFSSPAERVKQLLDRPLITGYLRGFENLEQRALAGSFAIEAMESRQRAINSGQQEQISDLGGRVEDLTGVVKGVCQAQAELVSYAQDQSARLGEIQTGLQQMKDEAEVIKAQVAEGNKNSALAVEKLTLLEDLEFGRMTPAEKVALIRRGHDLKLDKTAIQQLERTVHLQGLAAEATRRMGQINEVAGILNNFGDLPAPIQTAISLGNAATTAFTRFASGDTLGAALSVAGWVSGRLGKQRPDPAVAMHNQLMGKLGQLLEGQHQLQLGQQQIFEQGRETLTLVADVHNLQVDTLNTLARMEQNLDLRFNQLSAEVREVHLDLHKGQVQILQQTIEILRGQIEIFNQGREVRKDIAELGRALSDVHHKIAKSLYVIHEDILLNRALLLDILGREIKIWQDELTTRRKEGNYDHFVLPFRSYGELEQWFRNKHTLVANADTSYNSLLPCTDDTTVFPEMSSLLWKTHYSDYELSSGAGETVRLAVFQPVVDYYRAMDNREAIVPRLVFPVNRMGLMARRDERMAHFEQGRVEIESRAFITREENFSQLLDFKYVVELAEGLPLLSKLIAIRNGERAFTQDELLNPHTHFSPNGRIYLERMRAIINLALAQQSLIAGDQIIPDLYVHFFRHVRECQLTQGKKEAFLKILYGETLTMNDEAQALMSLYQNTPSLRFSTKNRRRLLSLLHKDLKNPLLVGNLMTYVINALVQERGITMASYSFALSIPVMRDGLKQLFPDWDFIYDDKKEQWFAFIQIPGTQEYCLLPMPISYRLYSDRMKHWPFHEELLNAKREVLDALSEIELGANPEIREAFVAAMESFADLH